MSELRGSEDPPLPPGALQRAGERIFRGPETPWDAKSRFGPAGKAARKLVRRAMRPFAHRQHEVDAALFDAVREAAEGSAERIPGLEMAAPIVGRDIQEAATPIGSFWVDAGDDSLAPTGSASPRPQIAALMQERLRPTMTFVDVGAGLGYFSVLGSRLVGNRGRVFAFEPGHRSLELLRANLWRNRCFNARVLPVAAWSQPGHLNLEPSPNGGGQAFVPCGRLDDLLAPPVHLLKVEMPNAGHNALRGAVTTIAASPDIAVVLEFAPGELEGAGERPEEVLGFYRGLGFEIQILEAGGRRRAGDEEIIGSGSRQDLLLQRP